MSDYIYVPRRSQFELSEFYYREARFCLAVDRDINRYKDYINKSIEQLRLELQHSDYDRTHRIILNHRISQLIYERDYTTSLSYYQKYMSDRSASGKSSPQIVVKVVKMAPPDSQSSCCDENRHKIHFLQEQLDELSLQLKRESDEKESLARELQYVRLELRMAQGAALLQTSDIIYESITDDPNHVDPDEKGEAERVSDPEEDSAYHSMAVEKNAEKDLLIEQLRDQLDEARSEISRLRDQLAQPQLDLDVHSRMLEDLD